MEQQISLVHEILQDGVKIVYIKSDSDDFEYRNDEIYIETNKLISCPNQNHIINAICKRIGRSSIFKSQKYTLSICILLLLSRGYCVTSNTLKGIDDSFIERCWECIQVISHNISNELSQWVVLCIDSRSTVNYALLFCDMKQSTTHTRSLNKNISSKGKFLNVNAQLFDVPSEIWHRDDILKQTAILHMRLRNCHISEYSQ